MAHYEYQGQHYELPDGISNDEALSKIKKHLGQTSSPKTSIMSDLVEGTKGTAAFAGDLLSGMVKLPTQAALAVGGKVADPSMSLQQTWETAGQAVEDTFPSFTKPLNVDPQKNRAYSTAMKPFELYGEGLNWAAEKGSFGNKDVQGAINIAGNVAPIPFAGKAAKAAGKVASRLDPGLYNIEVDAANAARQKKANVTMADIVAEEKVALQKATIPDDLGTQIARDRYNNDAQVAMLEAALAKRNEPLPTITVDQNKRAMLPDELEVQRTFERGMAAEDAIAARQAQLEFDVKRQTALDQGAALRARQEAAPTGYESWVEQMRQDISGQPGTNETINWPRRVADRFPQTETSPMGEGFKYEGALDPGLNDARSLPIEIADALRTGDRPVDPFDRYSPQQAANRILREGEHPPIRKGGGPARGAIDPDLLTLGLTKLFHGGREFKEWNPRTIGTGEKMAALGPGLYASDNAKLAEIYKKYGDQIHFDDAGNVVTTPGVLNEMAVKHDNILDYRAKGNEAKWKQATENLDKAGLKASTRGVQGALQHAAEYGLGAEARKAMVDAGVDGMYVQLGGTMGKEIVIFNPDIIAQVSRTDTPVEKYSGRFNKQRGAIFLNKNKEGKEVSKILNLKNTPYNRITSVDQVLQDPGKDLPGRIQALRTTADYLQSGLEGTLRHNTTNTGVNFARTRFQEARNFAEELSKRYLTDNKTGLNTELNKLSINEKTSVVNLMLELDRQQVPLSESIMTKAGFTEKQKSVANRMREASDALYAEKNRILGEQGYDAHTYREGYMPGNFGGAYKTLIGYKDSKGEFHITGVAQADTKLGHEKALEWYRKQGNNEYAMEIPMGRHGVGERVYSSAYDGWADLIQAVAKHDKSFGEALAMSQQMSKDSVASLYNFQVHEKAKKGIVGSYGNRPWLTPEQNAKEFIRGYIDYLEEGYKYTSYQSVLNDINLLVSNPEYRSSHPNTVKYLERYVKHVTGNNLNHIGATANWAVDKTASMMGLGNSQFNRVNHELTQASTLHMMGVFNPGFLLAQLTQWATGGIPEAAQIRATLKHDPNVMLDSLTKTVTDITALSMEENFNIKAKNVPDHIREAYKWGHDNGLFTFSEVALAHQVLQSKLRRKVEPMLDWPIRLGEQATRPTIFLAFTDMFYKAGFRGEEAMLRAQAATDFAMVNYHPDERPMIYQSLGVLGNSLGALSTYKHNLISQYGARGADAAKYPAAAATMIGLGYALYGLSGLPGYQEASELSEKLTGKPIREQVLSNPKEGNALMDGALSAYTGMDFQSRLSMSSVLPDTPMSAFPHISNFYNVMDKAFDAGMNWDQASSQALAKAAAPAGLRGAVESQLYPDGKVLDKDMQQKYDRPRSKEEQMVRNILGTRPLRERLQDEKVWSTRKSEAKRADNLKDSLSRFDRAYLLGDIDGMAKAEDKYVENDGDIRTLYNSQRLKDVITNANMSEPNRRAGKPTNNLNTLKRYEEFSK